jgi:hypothetical protein
VEDKKIHTTKGDDYENQKIQEEILCLRSFAFLYQPFFHAEEEKKKDRTYLCLSERKSRETSIFLRQEAKN